MEGINMDEIKLKRGPKPGPGSFRMSFENPASEMESRALLKLSTMSPAERTRYLGLLESIREENQ